MVPALARYQGCFSHRNFEHVYTASDWVRKSCHEAQNASSVCTKLGNEYNALELDWVCAKKKNQDRELTGTKPTLLWGVYIVSIPRFRVHGVGVPWFTAALLIKSLCPHAKKSLDSRAPSNLFTCTNHVFPLITAALLENYTERSESRGRLVLGKTRLRGIGSY